MMTKPDTFAPDPALMRLKDNILATNLNPKQDIRD